LRQGARIDHRELDVDATGYGLQFDIDRCLASGVQHVDDLLEHRVIVVVSGQSALADAPRTGQGCIQEALDGAKHRFPDAALAGGRPHLDPQIRRVRHTAMP